MAGWIVLGRSLCVSMLLVMCVACGSGPQLKPETAALPERVELVDVPFFYLSEASGGSSALAAVLNHHSVISTPGLIEARIQELARGQREREALAVVARSYDQAVYPLSAELDALIQQVAGKNPVLVQLDKSFSGPGGEFALLVGYDRRERILILRKGNARRLRVSLNDFDQQWAEAGRWAVVVLPANVLPAQAEHERWLDTLRALQQQGRDAAVRRGLAAAKAKWPDAQL